MSKYDLKELVKKVVELSYEAGDRIMEIYDRGFSVVEKQDHSPLTEADMAAHATIDDGLQIIAEEYPVLSEESAEIPFDERKYWETYWLVDPLDGTREFIKRNGEFTVNIALIHKTKSILGVVYAPASKTCYFATENGGAFKTDADGTTTQIRVRKPCKQPPLIAGSRSHRSESLNKFLDNLDQYEIISVGSALKSCLVAEGKADLYPRLGLTSEWDTAAAQCIVEQAGGHLTDTNMDTMCYNVKENLLNPEFFVFGDSHINWSKYL